MQCGGQRELQNQSLRGGFGFWFQAAAVGRTHPGSGPRLRGIGERNPFRVWMPLCRDSSFDNSTERLPSRTPQVE